ncbi:MAG: sugar phosphate isomerase/epimerase [Actinobacteria bacterium]|nr:sugar phosphate isomerase/epimerase [Actinomycetota bacterium]
MDLLDMRRILLSTGNLVYRFELEEIAEMAGNAGVYGLEVVINKRIVEMYEKTKQGLFNLKTLPVVSLHAPYHIIHSWGTLKYELLRTIEIAKKGGIELVVFHPPLNPLLQPSFWKFFKSVEDFKKLGEEKVAVSIETLPRSMMTKFSCTPQSIYKWAVEKNLAVTLDCTHIASWGLNPLEALQYFGSLVRSIHLNNTHDCHIDSHLPPNDGCLDISSLLSYINEHNFYSNLDLVLEINFHLKNRNEIGKIIRDAVEFVELHFN